MDGYHRPGIFSLLKNAILNAFDALGDAALRDVAIIKKELDLFLGVALSTIGLFHFRSDKFCDGNSVDYLSCTRPSSFHYYGAFEVTLIVLGTFFVLLWFLKRSREV